MTAIAAHSNVHGIGARENGSLVPAYFTSRQTRTVVERQDIVRPGKFCKEPGAQHGVRAADGFLGGLADQNKSPAPLIFELCKHARGTHEDRHVNVMAASVHDANLSAIGALYFHVASIRQPGIFHDRQRIHIGTDVYRWTRTIAKDSDDSVGNKAGRFILAKVVGDVVAELAQLCRDE